jgi:hypothetical protein
MDGSLLGDAVRHFCSSAPHQLEESTFSDRSQKGR